MKHPTTIILATVLATYTSATSAQVRCTMPNGLIIEQRLAATCPAGAVRGETLSGTPIAIQPLPSPPQQTPPTQPTAAAATPKPSQPIQQTPSPYDLAQALCHHLLKNSIATSCQIDSNILSTSTIEATLPGGITAAELICNQISGSFHKARRHTNESNWELLSYTPHGSSNRPMARCPL